MNKILEKLMDSSILKEHDQLAYASYPYCEWADDVRIAAKKLEINFITLKNI
jgi:hypothetical protein